MVGKFKFFLILSLLISFNSQICKDPFKETSVYVDPQNLCGECKNSNNGSIRFPVCSIVDGLKLLSPSGRILLRDGVHRVNQEVSVYATNGNYLFSGLDKENPTVFQNFPNERAQIYLSRNVSGWNLHSGNTYRRYWLDYVEKTDVNHYPQMVVINDDVESPVLLQQVNSTSFTSCTGSMLPPVRKGLIDMEAGDFFYEKSTSMLYVWLPDSSDPNNHEIEVGLSRFFRIAEVENFTVSGLEFRYSGSENLQCGWSMTIFSGKNIKIINNKFIYSDSTCLGGGGTNILIKNNEMSHCGNSGSGLKGDGVVYSYNVFSYNNWRKYNPSWHAGGIKIIPNVNNMVMRRNIVSNNYGSGIWFDCMGYNITIEENIVFNNTRAGIFVEITKGVRGKENHVCGNVVVRNFRGVYVSGSNFTNVYQNSFFQNNEQISFHGIPRTDNTLMFNNAYNNVVVKSITSPIQPAFEFGWHSQVCQAPTALENWFYDNLYDETGFFSCGPGYYHLYNFNTWKDNGMDLDGNRESENSFKSFTLSAGVENILYSTVNKNNPVEMY